MNKLKRRPHIIVNGCPTCLADEETMNHLLVHCRFAPRVWTAVFKFRMLWVIPKTVSKLFQVSKMEDPLQQVATPDNSMNFTRL